MARRQWDRMKTPTFLREQLREIAADIEQAKSEGKAWTAIAQMRRLVVDLRKELDELEKAEQAPQEESMTDDELVAILLDAIRQMPDDLLDQVEEALLARRGPTLRLVDGGA